MDIKLTTTSDVKRFCAIANEQSFNIDVLSGRCMLDAKSILGLFSLDRNKIIKCQVHASQTEFESFMKSIEDFIVK